MPIPPQLQAWCKERSISEVRPTTEAMRLLFSMALKMPGSEFLTLASKLSLLYLQTLPRVSLANEAYAQGKVQRLRGCEVFVPEHAVARSIWKEGKSLLVFGAAGTV